MTTMSPPECVEQLLIDPGAQGAANDQQRQQPIGM